MSFRKCLKCTFLLYLFINPASISGADDGLNSHGLNSQGLAHKYELRKQGYVLRSPKSEHEWSAYHKIRKEEIVRRYCSPNYVYDGQDLEELSDYNYRFIFTDSNLKGTPVIGVIRVDLLKGAESSIRWVAIASEFQKNGYGRHMLSLVEEFAKLKGRTLIRVPSEEVSKGFYEKVGFELKPWPNAPKNDGDVFMAKEIAG